MWEFIAASFALLGAFIGVIFAGVADRKKRFNETVSQRRVEWIRQMSENTGKILACATLLHKKGLEKELEDNSEKSLYNTGLLLSFYKSKFFIQSQLNTSEPEHQMLISLLSQLDEFIGKDERSDFNSTRDGILDIVRLIEKTEWDKTKNEARGIKG